MSANLKREMMIFVERVVRPLPLPLNRQRRLRTELMEHLQAVHAQELLADGGPEAAWVRTQQRFGDPALLTAEFRGAIRWWERWESWLQRRLAQRSTESVMRYTARLVGFFFAFVSLVCLANLLVYHFFGTQRISIAEIRLVGAMVVFLAFWQGSFLSLSLHLGSEWHRPQRRWGRIIPYTVGLMATWPASLALLFGLLGGFAWIDGTDPLAGVLVDSISVLGALLHVVGGAIVGVFHHRETRYRNRWATLDLSEV